MAPAQSALASTPQCLDSSSKKARPPRSFEIAPAAARKLPKDMIGRVLEGAEVERLMRSSPPRKNRRVGCHHHNWMRGPRILGKRHFGSPKEKPRREGLEDYHEPEHFEKFSAKHSPERGTKLRARAFPSRMTPTVVAEAMHSRCVTPFPDGFLFCPRTQPNYFRCACP